MQVVIEDKANDILIVERATGDYAPDVMDDLNNRGLAAYKDILTFQINLGTEYATEATSEGETK